MIAMRNKILVWKQLIGYIWSAMINTAITMIWHKMQRNLPLILQWKVIFLPNWFFPILFLEGPNNIKSMENIMLIPKEDMLNGICENGTKF